MYIFFLEKTTRIINRAHRENERIRRDSFFFTSSTTDATRQHKRIEKQTRFLYYYYYYYIFLSIRFAFYCSKRQSVV